MNNITRLNTIIILITVTLLSVLLYSTYNMFSLNYMEEMTTKYGAMYNGTVPGDMMALMAVMVSCMVTGAVSYGLWHGLNQLMCMLPAKRRYAIACKEAQVWAVTPYAPRSFGDATWMDSEAYNRAASNTYDLIADKNIEVGYVMQPIIDTFWAGVERSVTARLESEKELVLV